MITHQLFSGSLILATIGVLMIFCASIMEDSENRRNVLESIIPLELAVGSGIIMEEQTHRC